MQCFLLVFCHSVIVVAQSLPFFHSEYKPLEALNETDLHHGLTRERACRKLTLIVYAAILKLQGYVAFCEPSFHIS